MTRYLNFKSFPPPSTPPPKVERNIKKIQKIHIERAVLLTLKFIQLIKTNIKKTLKESFDSNLCFFKFKESISP